MMTARMVLSRYLAGKGHHEHFFPGTLPSSNPKTLLSCEISVVTPLRISMEGSLGFGELLWLFLKKPVLLILFPTYIVYFSFWCRILFASLSN